MVARDISFNFPSMKNCLRLMINFFIEVAETKTTVFQLLIFLKKKRYIVKVYT